MGYIEHTAVVVTAADYPWLGIGSVAPVDVDAFRTEMPERIRDLLVGPIPSPVNGYRTWFFAPSGSKSGWADAELTDEWQRRFVALWSERNADGSGPYDVVRIRYGEDFGWENDTEVMFSTDNPAEPAADPAVGVALPEPTETWVPKVGEMVSIPFNKDPAKVLSVGADSATVETTGFFRVVQYAIADLRPAPSVSPTEEKKP